MTKLLQTNLWNTLLQIMWKSTVIFAPLTVESFDENMCEKPVSS